MKKYIQSFLFIVLMCFALVAKAQEYKTHKVKQGETVFSISKLYNVTPYDIYKLNPDAKDGISVNSVLIIPNSKLESVTTVEEKEFVGYKTHKVRRKETLFGIAKMYNITQDDLKKHNPILYSSNLKKGKKLQIPVFKTVKKIVKNDDLVKNYTVLPKEGKWRVAYKFGISVDELEKLNPEMGSSLQEGQVIKVPNIANNELRDLDENYSYYKVLPKEGFYRLEKKIGLTQEQLEKLNPELKEVGLKEGMILKIPKNTFVKDKITIQESLSLADSIKNFSRKHLAVMLPFKLNTINADSVSDAKAKIKNDKTLSVSLDFHSGVLMALDFAKQKGISVELDVYDTKNQQSETTNIIRSENFTDVDAVIGPLMQSNFEKAAVALSDNNIPIISPLTTREVRLYDNVFQSRPSTKMLQERIVSFVQNDTLVKQVFVIYDSKSVQKLKYLKNKFPNAKVIASKKNKEGKDLNYILKDDFMIGKNDVNIFSEGKNVVFLETESSGLVSNVASILNSLNSDKKQVILVTTDKNEAFEEEGISNVYLSNLQFHYPSIRKDYDVTTSNEFVASYKSKYGYEPNLYAVRGFDITMDVLLRLASFDNLYDSTKLENETAYTENKFLYKKKLFGGYYNTAVYIVKYDNLKIVDAEESLR